jgi:hypothetical protein
MRKVFSESLDIVVHLGRDDIPRGDAAGIRREVIEILAVVPTLSDDFTVEPIFTRAELGCPLEWSGALPVALEQRFARSLPNGWTLRTMLEGGDGPV